MRIWLSPKTRISRKHGIVFFPPFASCPNPKRNMSLRTGPSISSPLNLLTLLTSCLGLLLFLFTQSLPSVDQLALSNPSTHHGFVSSLLIFFICSFETLHLIIVLFYCILFFFPLPTYRQCTLGELLSAMMFFYGGDIMSRGQSLISLLRRTRFVSYFFFIITFDHLLLVACSLKEL